MATVPRDVWGAWPPERQSAAQAVGLVPEPEPWMDDAYERLTGKCPTRPADDSEASR